MDVEDGFSTWGFQKAGEKQTKMCGIFVQQKIRWVLAYFHMIFM